MIFTETNLKDVLVVDLEKREDERGFFARTWCKREFQDKGLKPSWVQANTAYSRFKRTLRGMHFQIAPHQEIKLVRCIQGRIFDVAVDLRPASETFLRWTGIELSSGNHRMFYVPEGFAHGYLTLSDDVEILYMVSAAYSPEAERGVRWNDPAFGIKWPEQPRIISEKDNSWIDFSY